MKVVVISYFQVQPIWIFIDRYFLYLIECNFDKSSQEMSEVQAEKRRLWTQLEKFERISVDCPSPTRPFASSIRSKSPRKDSPTPSSCRTNKLPASSSFSASSKHQRDSERILLFSAFKRVGKWSANRDKNVVRLILLGGYAIFDSLRLTLNLLWKHWFN